MLGLFFFDGLEEEEEEEEENIDMVLSDWPHARCLNERKNSRHRSEERVAGNRMACMVQRLSNQVVAVLLPNMLE